MTAADFHPLVLVLIAAAGALGLLALDLFLPTARKHRLALVAFALFAGLFVASFILDTSGAAFAGAYRGNAWVLEIQRVVLVAAALSSLGGARHVAEHAANRQGEYYALLVFSVVGMMLAPGARDLIFLVVSFELMGVPLYVLAAIVRREEAQDADPQRVSEASLKLYIVGAASTAITLFGLAIVLGMAGGTSYDQLARTPATPVVALGELLVLAGMSFKIGAAPFHMWLPDTYEGASTPFVALLSVAPKTAAVGAIAALFLGGFGAHHGAWLPPLLVVCAMTLVVGTLLAVPQTSAKRLLAYSGVAQIGYVLMALATGTSFGLGTVVFFLAAYTVTNLGAFLVIHAVSRTGTDDSLARFDGLARRSPWLALALLVFLLSLAGIPFAVGFWAKLYIFIAVFRAHMVWLVVLGATLAVVSVFYYLRIARAMYIEPPSDASPLRVEPSLRIAIVACMLAVVALGAWPSPLVEASSRGAAALLGP